jgi:hypothetical protein
VASGYLNVALALVVSSVTQSTPSIYIGLAHADSCVSVAKADRFAIDA